MIHQLRSKWPETKAHIREILLFLPKFLRNPVEGMKKGVDWNWHSIFILQIALAVVIGFLSGVLKGSSFRAYVNMATFPIATIATNFLGSLFFYYYFQSQLGSKVRFRELYTVFFLANIIFLLLQIFSSFGIPIELIGLACTCFLLLVGFVEHFGLPRNRLIKIISALYACFFILWAVSIFVRSKKEVELKDSVHPKSLDIIEQELRKPNRNDKENF